VPGKVEVELDIFSGRPNPVWTLPEAEATAFRQKVDGLPKATSGQVANNLGYRGFVVRADGKVILVQRGVVRVTAGETTEYATDPNRGLERWLLQSGKPFLEAGLFTTAEHEIGG